MKGMVIQDMKKMFHRIGAMALVFMLALSLATPAMADTTESATPHLKIEGALEGVRYDVYSLLVLVGQTGTSYEYKLATDEDGNLTPAATAVQSVINGFLAKDNDGYGFELISNNRVVFRVVTEEVTETDPETKAETKHTETMDDAYARWKDTPKGKLFLTKFADAVKAAAEGKTDNLGPRVASVKDKYPESSSTIPNPDYAEGNGQPETIPNPKYDPLVEADKDNSKSKIEIELGTGYYLVISSAGQRAMISTQGNEGATITEKNTAPKLEKTVGEVADGEFKSKNDAAIGDVIGFRVVIEARKGVNNLTFKDTLSSGLTFKELARVRFVPLNAGVGKDAIEFDINGYPKSTENIRTVYTDSVPTNGTNFSSKTDAEGKTYTDKGVVNLWSKNETENNLVRVSLPNGADNTSNIEIEFKSQWLNSKRSAVQDNDGTGTAFDKEPMETGDRRLGHWGPDDQAAAKYNMYLGDVSNPEDDGGLILIDYTATLNKDAVVGGAGNKNDAHLEYGNDPTDKITVKDTSKDHTNTYTYQIDVSKFEKDNEGKFLKGAEFDLYRLENADGALAEIGTAADSPIKFVPGDETTGTAAKIEVSDSLLNAPSITGDSTSVNGNKNVFRRIRTGLVTGEDGRIPSVTGLDSGLYALVETTAPDGYIKAEKPIYAVIGGVHSGSASVDATTENVDMNVYVVKTEGDADNRWTFELSGKTGKVSKVLELNDDGTLKLDANRNPIMKDAPNEYDVELVGVANASGLVMPTTGGIGTTVFYVVGGILIAGAGVLLVLKKREGSSRE